MSRPPHAWELSSHPDDLELAEPSEWLLAHAVKRRNGTAEPLPAVIRDGAWHDTMVSAAGTLRRRGFSEQAAVAALVTENHGKYEGDHPLDDQELAELVADVYHRYQADEELSLRRKEPLAEVAAALGEPTLQVVLAAVRRYLELDAREAIAFAVVLAVAVARDLVDEEPLWLMVVGAPGSGKTEAILLCKLTADGRVDELTRAGLLSWSSVGKKTRRTGLLTRIPEVAFVTISDFSTVVTMGDREARARMFGALRVIYDGRLYRSIGGQPAGEGEELEWEGHLTLLAAATPAVDTHFSFEAALGERWLLFRLDEAEDERARRHARYTVDRETANPLREEAQSLAAALVHHARRRIPAHLSEASKEAIVNVAFLAAHARTGVQFEGSGRYRVAMGYPFPEEPTRLAGQMNRLARCLVALGVPETVAVSIATQAARDSIPFARRKAFEHVVTSDFATVSSTWNAIGRGSWWSAKWELAALEAIGIVETESTGSDADDEATTVVYRLTTRYKAVCTSVASFFTPLSIKGEE